MYKGKFYVPSVEHQGDIDYFSGVIRNAGGEIIKEYWDGEEDCNAYIHYQCSCEKQLSEVKQALEDA